MTTNVTFLTGLPTIEVLAAMALDLDGVREMARWIKDRRPECLPAEYDPDTASVDSNAELALFPHRGQRYPYRVVDLRSEDEMLTDNELLVELAGRKCYDSFGLKAGRKSNAEYIEHTQQGEIPHRSIMYHAKLTFFFAGLSRRVSQELMRNYVGADRDQEGCPSQESTRYTQQTGRYVAHPYLLDKPAELERWKAGIAVSHAEYEAFIARRVLAFREENGRDPTGADRKHIYEAAIGRLPWEFETSVVWTTNPAALTKLLIERDHEGADKEFQRFARYLKLVCVKRAPNLFPRFRDAWANLNLGTPEGDRLAMHPWPAPL